VSNKVAKDKTEDAIETVKEKVTKDAVKEAIFDGDEED
jgi:hypothetical protein